MFTLEVLESVDEKIAYITHIRKDIAKTIECFESEKVVSLRMYGDETVHLEDNCPELQVFVQEMIKKYSPATPDRRIPSNDQLRDLIKKESQEYHKLDRILEFYFVELKRDADIVTLEDEKDILNKALNDEPSEDKIIQVNDITKKPAEDKTPHPEVNITSSIESDSVNFMSSNEEDDSEIDSATEKKISKKTLKKVHVNHKKEKETPPDDDIVRDSQ